MSLKILQTEYKKQLKEPNYFYSINPNLKNFYIWDVLLLGPPETIFEGGIFECRFEFPHDYPMKPPVFRFITNLPHPNIYEDGKVCISILHEGADEFGYEHISERWSSTQNINSILMSILSILSEPNFESPANIDIANMWKNDFNSYKKIIYKMIAIKH
jgi:ubiquitin-conjugating enzyme E2 G1